MSPALKKILKLSPSQKDALAVLQGQGNVFLTGSAGSGKSFLLRHFLRDLDPERFPILASTGAAAILIGGRTFHSFFGLGIMEGGVHETVERALRNKRLMKRLKKTDGVVIDEVSMLSGAHLQAAELVARKARGNTSPWGGLRVIVVGDFAQLPPVNPFGSEKDWAFLDPVWERSEFRAAVLYETLRTADEEFIEVLNSVRIGKVTPSVTRFLSSKTKQLSPDTEGTRLFARKDTVEKFNLGRLEKIKSPQHSFPTLYSGKEVEIEKFKKNSPIPEVITLKEGALVMLRHNDPEGKWVNGSLGTVKSIQEQNLRIELLSGREIEVGVEDFTLLDAEGKPVVTARNFPVTLAWALTIHKSQGTTLDRLQVDLRGLWEPGQAYVALSRLSSGKGLYLEGWDARSIFTDSAVTRFHEGLEPAFGD